jgi:molecular chaperone HscB
MSQPPMFMDLQGDFFGLFGLQPVFRLDEAALDAAFRELQGQVHPDRYAHASDTEKRLSMQWATRVNEAYRTLRKPLSRARYLLSLRGVDVALESNTAMSTEFLMAQLEWREAVEDARQAGEARALEKLQGQLRLESRSLVDGLGVDLDDRHADQDAAESVRRMMFLEKLQQEIDDALEALES